MNTKTKDIYILSRIKGVGPAALTKIINAGFSSINELCSLGSEEELKKLIRGGPNQSIAIDTILNGSDHHVDSIENEIEELDSIDIQIFSKWDDNYPPGYKLLNNKAPLFIYTKGNTELLHEQNSIAIIGTRDCSNEGIKIAKKTAIHFAGLGYTIVSGLAEGIDTAAHEGALDAKGNTTAVVVDVKNIFPEKNKGLAKNILDSGGLLIAENPPGTIPVGHLFVSRDRLQSGLSLAVFPIETDIKGGTMHTVRFSEEQNRLLYVPDLISIEQYDHDNDKARGIFELIYSKRAQKYTESRYDQIINELKNKKKELYNPLILDNDHEKEQNKGKDLFGDEV